METRLSPARSLLPVVAVVLLLRLPFLNQAIQGDDDAYIAEASHALIEPLHPAHGTYVFQGGAVDLRGHPHPPLNAWILAGLLAIFGDVKEVPFHGAYVLFSLLAAMGMWWLARRFSPQPLWATLLFLAVPAFVVNGNSLETDLPFLAFWTGAVALFCAGRLLWAALAMALAAMTSYQAVFLTPILAVYLWQRRAGPQAAPASTSPLTAGLASGRHGQLAATLDRGWRPAVSGWAVIFTPPAVVAAWQTFERLSTGELPAAVLTGYFSTYGFQALTLKLQNAAGLAIHLCFMIFPALVPATLALAWRKRRDPDTFFLLAWIGIFFAGAIVVFFAGSARYLLPVAAPLALLASRLRARWLAPAFASQMALSIGLAVVSYEHWDAVRQFAAELRGRSAGHRVWVNGELGLRYYLEADGALPLLRSTPTRPGDIVVTSDLTRWTGVTAPVSTLARTGVRPALPLRLIGVESHSGFSTVSRGLWPFGISRGIIDRLRADVLLERHPTLEYLPMDAPQASEQIVSGIYPDRWMGQTATVILKSTAQRGPLALSFFIPPQARARTVTLRLNGRQVARQTYTAPGTYTLESLPLASSTAAADVEIDVDQTFRAPPDTRDLGIIVTAVGFRR